MYHDSNIILFKMSISELDCFSNGVIKVLKSEEKFSMGRRKFRCEALGLPAADSGVALAQHVVS